MERGKTICGLEQVGSHYDVFFFALLNMTVRNVTQGCYFLFCLFLCQRSGLCKLITADICANFGTQSMVSLGQKPTINSSVLSLLE